MASKRVMLEADPSSVESKLRIVKVRDMQVSQVMNLYSEMYCFFTGYIVLNRKTMPSKSWTAS